MKKCIIFLFLICGVFSLLSFPAIASANPANQKYALLIGIDKYTSREFKPLGGAKNDVDLIKGLLTGSFGFKEENMTILLDEQATHENIKKAFQDLAGRVSKGDLVYIHYSGHGSYMPDLNGDESKAWAKDSTWVSYGARTKAEVPVKKDRGKSTPGKQKKPVAVTVSATDLNDFDILDDEIGVWLAELSAKTDQIVFVSDSCHSGTITRGGDALMTRAVPMDTRKHPLGTMPVEKVPLSVVQISAARDDERAAEFTAPDDKNHGIFTWFFAQSLQDSRPDDTWRDLFNKTSTLMRYRNATQNPQIRGQQQGKPLFGGEFEAQSSKTVVRLVDDNNAIVMIDRGSLLGVTVGSIYKKQTKNEETATLEITKTEPTKSEGKAKGKFKVGDLVSLEHYQHNTAPVKIFVRADMDKDRGLKEKIEKRVQNVPAYEVVSNQQQSDIVLQILRPGKDEKGKYIFKTANDSLPQSFKDRAPECWVLTPAEIIYNDNLKIGMTNQDEGIKALCKNLVKMTGVRNLLSLSAAPGQESPLDLDVTIWSEVKADFKGEKTQMDGEWWKKEKKITAQYLQENTVRQNQLLSFTIRNKSEETYYVYLINITASGDITPFYPHATEDKAAGLIKPGGILDIDRSLKMNEPGNEYVRMIASIKPLDIYVLEQKGFAERGTRGNPLNPLESLLSAKAGFTRGDNNRPIATSEWTTVQGSIKVVP